MDPTEALEVPVYNDADKPVAFMRILVAYVAQIAKESGLDDWDPMSVGFYACSDGPLLTIHGTAKGKPTIHGITIEVGTLNENSYFFEMWKAHKALLLSRAVIHNAILARLNQPAN